jgi:predicted RNase H-like nuclease
VVTVGTDGCRRGWVLAVAGEGASSPPTVHVVPDFRAIVALVDGGGVAGVDIPIGLIDGGPRACDRLTRRFVGERRASVFPAPARAVLGARSYEEACARSRAATGRALSRQAYGLLAKVAEVDALMTCERQTRLAEVHPEASFTELMGRPPRHGKRTPAGRLERLAALQDVIPGVAGATGPLPGAAPDDVLDALVVLWSAARMAAGTAVRLGDGAVDGRGLRMEILR